MFTNDLFKDGKILNDLKNFFPTTIEDNVIIGSNSTILPVKICSGTVIGAGSVVTKDIKIKVHMLVIQPNFYGSFNLF